MYSAVLATALTGFAVVNAQAPSPVPGVTGALGDARIVTDNVPGTTYTAFVNETATSSITGFIAGTANANGTGVQFMYHIHDQPVPANGNCTATLAHLDSYIRGEQPPCDSTHPETCQDGDLSGKHGKITSDPFNTAYLDLYLSTQQGPSSFFGNRSIVIHTSNTTRLSCANFTLTSGADTGSNATIPGGNGTVAGGSPPAPFTGGAAAAFVSAGAVLAGVAALML
ncbi:MAG: hypothetical protein Q9183_000092 [Haloplaca sp. 2 TL-2023]